MHKAHMRAAILRELETLSLPTKQLEYERSLAERPGNARSELTSVFCDDLFCLRNRSFVDAFSEDELKGLAHLYGLIVEASTSVNQSHSVSELLRTPEWRKVVARAKELYAQLQRDA